MKNKYFDNHLKEFRIRRLKLISKSNIMPYGLKGEKISKMYGMYILGLRLIGIERYRMAAIEMMKDIDYEDYRNKLINDDSITKEP